MEKIDEYGFKSILKKYRTEKNLSAEQMADMLNVSKGSISLWENGKQIPKKKTIELFLEVTGLSSEYMYDPTDEIELILIDDIDWLRKQLYHSKDEVNEAQKKVINALESLVQEQNENKSLLKTIIKLSSKMEV